MIVRKIRPLEYQRSQALSALVFEYPMKHAGWTPQAVLDWLRQNPVPRQEGCLDGRFAAFEDDDETMMATLTVIPWTASFDGGQVAMGGVAGVATLPQYRGLGAARKCMEAAIRDMYERGMALSYLYAVSSRLYSPLGYGAACEAVRWRVRLEDLPGGAPGRWHLLEGPGAALDAIRELDRDFQRRYNGMIVAGDPEYLWTKKNPFNSKEFTYVYEDGEGRPAGYLSMVPDGDLIDCPRFVFTGRAGLQGLLALLRRMAPGHTEASFRLPADVDLTGVLPEWGEGRVARALEPRGMVRAIDAALLLRRAKARGSGALNIAVCDELIPENNACFRVTFAPGEEKRVERVREAPDVEMTVRDFGRMILGCCDAADPEWHPDVRLHCPPAEAAKLFYRKPAFISEFF